MNKTPIEKTAGKNSFALKPSEDKMGDQLEKTPVTVLQEMLVKSQQIPMYEIYKDESKPGFFNCLVSCESKTARGSGRSKKDAKQAAAQNMIEIIYDSTVQKISKKDFDQQYDNDDAIKKLRFMCTKYNLEKPEYLGTQKIPTPHGTMFNCKCVVAEFETKGSGISSVLAMQDAAEKMIIELDDFFTEYHNHHHNRNGNDNSNDDDVKKLKLMCTKYNLDNPEYTERKIVKSPYGTSIYSCKCSVAGFETKGNGSTCNLAMQDAAKKMIVELKDFFAEDVKTTKKDNNFNKAVKVENNNVSSIENIMSSCNLNESNTSKDFWMNLKKDLRPTHSAELVYISALAKECIQNINSKNVKIFNENFTKFLSLYEGLLKTLNINTHHMVIKSKDSDMYLFIIQLNLYSEMMEMSLGVTKDEAKLRAMNKILEVIKRNLDL